MHTLLVIAFGALTIPVNAFWRMECRARSGVGQIDPLMTPGEVSPHAHIIHGSGNFGFDSNEDSLKAASCTSCAVTQDLSAYWTPPLMFMDDQGNAEMVEQVGGMLAYYMLNGENIQAFPHGFQMISGDTFRRNSTLPPQPGSPDDPNPNALHVGDTSQATLRQKALGFNCLHYQSQPEGSLQRNHLPSKEYLDANCPDGIRLEVMFPSCWNGKDADSLDHSSHMAFPDGVMAGNCPQGFDSRLPSMFYETIFNTAAYKGKSGQFVIANGDPTGLGYHGDFIAGWDQGFLQNSINTCTNPSGRIQDCPLFTIQDESDAEKCQFPQPKQIAKIDYLGTNKGLPGGVQIQSGPGYATEQPMPLVAGPTPAPANPSSSSSAAAGVFAEPSATPSPAPSPSIDPVYSQVSQITSQPSPSPASPPESAPAVTPAAAPPSTQEGSAIATSVWTSNGEVMNMVIMETETTVTVDAETTTVPAMLKRGPHLHRHKHARRRHYYH